MRHTSLVGAFLLATVLMPMSRAAAQQNTGSQLTSLFFDCQAPGCRDDDFFRREIPFVNWVRDREVADVHLLIRSEQTGGGGRQYRLAFIGSGPLEGTDHEVVLSTRADATSDEQRSAIAERVKLGLVPYVQGTPAADRLRVVITDAAGGPPSEGRPFDGPGAGEAAVATDDPWDFWVFRINANGFLNGQATASSSNMFGNASADRVTDAWKISIGGEYSRNVQRFEISDGSTVRETRQDWGTNALAVRSIGDRWAVGARADIGSSTFLNQDLRWTVKPGIEFNFFPYEESSQRSLTLQYLIGPNHFDYTEETIFLKTEETLAQQSLTARLSLVQPWGRWSTSVTGEQYLHDASKYNVTLSGNFNIRLFRGFSVRMGGNYSWIRDQLFVSAAGATDEQILLRQRQLETSYRYFTSFGIEYRFGSIFNNVVNPRFGSGGGVMFF
ncbi:MAG: DUF481 domain-containing protein [Gemmatimonadota bacterium]